MKTKKRTGRRALALLLLTATLFALFAGCGEEEKPTEEGDLWGTAEGLTGKDAVFPEEEAEKGFAVTRKTVEGVRTYVSLARDGDAYLLSAYTEDGEESIRLDREFQVISRELMKEEDHQIYAYLDPGKSGEKTFTLEAWKVSAASGINERRLFVCKDGERVASAADFSGDFTDIRLLPTEEGLWTINYHFLFCDGKQVELPDPDPGFHWIGNGYMTFGGKNYAVMYARNEGRNKEEWYLMELRGKGIGEVLKTNISGYLFVPGEGKGANLFLADGEIRLADGKKIYDGGNLVKMGLGTDSFRVGWREEDRIVLLSGQHEIVILTEGEEASDDTEEIVIGAVAGPVNVPMDAITRFNQEKLGVVSIKIYQNEEKLNLALLSKEVDLVWGYDPEILFDRAKAGALDPIGDYMDVSGIYPNLVELGSRDGKCWFLPADFSLMGAVMPESAVGERMYFTGMDDLDKALSALPAEVYQQATKSDILYYIDPMEWVDPESNTCDFQNANFLKLLEIAGRFAEHRETVEAFFESNSYMPFFCAASMNRCINDTNTPEDLGEKYGDYTGRHPESGVSTEGKLLPAPGNGRFRGLAVDSNNLVAVAAGNDRKAEIKTFLAFLFSGATEMELGGKDYAQFCANKRANWDVMLEAYYQREKMKYLVAGEIPTRDVIDEATEAWRTEIEEKILSADHWAVRSNSEYRKVMNEEVSRYFAGEITAEKAAEYIQNRISLMLAEKG